MVMLLGLLTLLTAAVELKKGLQQETQPLCACCAATHKLSQASGRDRTQGLDLQPISLQPAI